MWVTWKDFVPEIYFVTDFVTVSTDIPFFVCVCMCSFSAQPSESIYCVWMHFANTGIMKSRLSFLQKIAKIIQYLLE